MGPAYSGGKPDPDKPNDLNRETEGARRVEESDEERDREGGRDE